MTNCPNCGAPVTGYRCEYCETVFDISKRDQILIDTELLKVTTKYIQESISRKQLYEDTIRAMRRYGCC